MKDGHMQQELLTDVLPTVVELKRLHHNGQISQVLLAHTTRLQFLKAITRLTQSPFHTLVSYPH